MTLTAMLLAGGQSRRMGTDKATLVVQGEPLWQRQLRLLRDLQPEAIWVSARSRPAWCPEDVEVVLDKPPSRGPLSGLSAALARLQTTHLFALAVDMPEMTAAHAKKLLTLVQPGRGVVPLNGDWFEPLCAIYASSAAAVTCCELEANRLSLQHLIRRLSEKEHITHYLVPEEERYLYRNANTPGAQL